MRSFKIYGNTTGQIFDLNSTPFFLHKIKNLGIKFKHDYLTIQNKQFKTLSEYQYENITGTLTIKGYDNYELFRKLLVRNQSFRFFYSPVSELERYIYCDFEIITKTELNAFGNLNCEFSIMPKSLWLKDIVINTEISNDGNEGKVYALIPAANEYGYTYDLTGLTDEWEYGYKYRGDINGMAELINDGDTEIPIVITIYGAISNPVVNLFDVNNNLIQQAQFTTEIGNNEKFIIDSNADNMKIVLVNSANQEIDKTSTQDYTKKTYITLPVGTFRIEITEQNLSPVSGMINYSTNYIGA